MRHSLPKAKKEPIPVTALRLPPELKKQLQKIANRQGVTLSHVMIHALEEYVEYISRKRT